jgi:hypothetical protein
MCAETGRRPPRWRLAAGGRLGQHLAALDDRPAPVGPGAGDVAALAARLDVEEVDQVGGIAPCREPLDRDVPRVVTGDAVDELDAHAVMVERREALQPRARGRRIGEGPQHVPPVVLGAGDRVAGAPQPGGPLHGTGEVAAVVTEVLDAHVGEREVERRWLPALLDPDGRRGLGEQHVAPPRPGRQRRRVPLDRPRVGVPAGGSGSGIHVSGN